MEKWVIRPEAKNRPFKFWPNQPDYVDRTKSFRPLPLLAAAMTAGSLCMVSRHRFWLTPAVLALITGLAAASRTFTGQTRWIGLAMVCLYMFMSVRAALVIMPAVNQAQRLDGATFQLEGVVCEILGGSNDRAEVLIRQKTGICVALYGKAGDLVSGRTIAVLAEARLTRARQNPGGFDEASWLLEKGCCLVCQAAPGENIRMLAREPLVSLAAWSAQGRHLFQRIAAKLLDEDEAGMLAALILGDTSGLADQQATDFRRSGLAHLTSVSGSNVSYMLLPFILVLKKARTKRTAKILALLTVLGAFGFLTGWPASVTRAILMSACALCGSMLYRRADAVNSLSMAVCLMTLMHPLVVVTAGFWLSAAASAALIIFCDPLASRIKKLLPLLPGFLAENLAAVICAQSVLLPITCSMSHEIRLAGIGANLIAVPLAGLIMLTGMALVPAGALLLLLPASCAVSLGRGLGMPLHVLLQVLTGLAHLCGDLSWGRIFMSQIHASFWFIWILLMLSWFMKDYWSRNHGRFGLAAWLLARLRLPAFLVLLALSLISYCQRPLVQVWFLSVGQGDAMVLQSREGYVVLVDGGKPGSGKEIIAPALDALGIGQINLALATHGHADHAGGLIELLEEGRIERLAVPQGLDGQPSGSFETDLSRDLLRTAGQKGIEVSELKRNDTIALGSLIRLEILYPEPMDGDFGITGEASGNERSVIMLADLAGTKLLMAADCDQAGEQALLEHEGWPQADILKVAHHGSRMTTSDAFLSQVQPQVAVISVGPNVYGHPTPDTLQRLDQIGCQVLRTDWQGAVQLKIGSRWIVRTMLPLIRKRIS
jgi:competence protein ComEC